MLLKAAVVFAFWMLVTPSFCDLKEKERIPSPFSDVLDLFSREKKLAAKKHNCEMKNLLSELDILNSQNLVISAFSALREMYCPCNGDPVDGLNRKSRMGTTLQMHFGGLSSHQCWRELDMFLTETLCGTQSSSINLEWAKFWDCDEDPKRRDCKPKFLEALQIQAKASPSSFNCLQYVEAVEHFLPVVRNVSHDSQIVHLDVEYVQYMQPEDYRHDRLYLLDIFKNVTSESCMLRKRELSSVRYIYERCVTGRRSESDCNFILNNSAVFGCISAREKVVDEDKQKVENSISMYEDGKVKVKSGRLYKYLYKRPENSTSFALFPIISQSRNIRKLSRSGSQ